MTGSVLTELNTNERGELVFMNMSDRQKKANEWSRSGRWAKVPSRIVKEIAVKCTVEEEVNWTSASKTDILLAFRAEYDLLQKSYREISPFFMRVYRFDPSVVRLDSVTFIELMDYAQELYEHSEFKIFRCMNRGGLKR